MVKGYYSYLLRLWQASTAGGAVWRASVEEVATGERRAFGGLDDLVAYLREYIKAGSPEEAPTGEECRPGAGEEAAHTGGEKTHLATGAA